MEVVITILFSGVFGAIVAWYFMRKPSKGSVGGGRSASGPSRDNRAEK